MDESDESTPMIAAEGDLNEILGMFDAPAFVRRGQDLEYSLARTDARCRRERDAMLEMVRLRLKQWAGAVAAGDPRGATFATPIDRLWPLCGVEAPAWSDRDAPPRRRRAIALDLIASVERFNRRWDRFLDGLDLDPVNRMIDHYNRYYILEKECSLGSHRLAARHFSPKPRLTREALRGRFPLLPVPALAAPPG